MIPTPKKYDALSIPVWFIEQKANEAEQRSEMEYRENGGYLDGNNYFYRYEALQGLLDDWIDWVGKQK
jgi:hypothetical protein